MELQRISDLDFDALTSDRSFFASPAAWEDEVLYFLMLDRFSDGREQGYRDNDGSVVASGSTPLFRAEDAGNAVRSDPDATAWRRPALAGLAARYVDFSPSSATSSASA